VTAPHFFVEHLDALGSDGIILLSAPDSRHALRVLRLRPGSDVTLADGGGRFARGRVDGERDRLAAIEVLEVETRQEPVPRVTVAAAPPKGDRLAWAVQKLAEIGVDEVDLVRGAERAVRTPRGDREQARGDRLRRIAREAAMQSRRPFVMEVGEVSIDAALSGAAPDEPVLMLWEGASRPMRPALDAVPEAATAVRILVGPEGGFSGSEVDRARAAGAAILSLGPAILRTETAALVGATLVLARFGRLG
jgi:16S rRNA (uracil1498-N3)-methyltransferase